MGLLSVAGDVLSFRPLDTTLLRVCVRERKRESESVVLVEKRCQREKWSGARVKNIS